MANSYFQFKQFTIHQDRSAMKVTTDGCLFGAWVSRRVRGNENRILDIGTGTGLLSLMMAQQHPSFFIDAIEIDHDSFEQASENVLASPWKDHIKAIHADIREHNNTNPFDIIVSNPPFYENELTGSDSKKNIAHHDHGLLLADLLKIIRQQLRAEGYFYLLLPYKRLEEVKKLFTDNQFTIQHMVSVRQSTTHDHFRIMLEGRITRDEGNATTSEEISIKDNNNEYTTEFTALLKDYYLRLGPL